MAFHPTGIYKMDYGADEGLFPTPFITASSITFFLFLLLLPLFFSKHIVFLSTTVFIAVIGAVGLNILTGMTGQISIAQGALIGVGAYTCGYFTENLGMPLWISIPSGGLITTLVGLIFGLPSIRIKGLYLLMSTLAAQFFLANYLFTQWAAVTKGQEGFVLNRPAFPGIPGNPNFGISLYDDSRFYYLVLLIAALTVFAGINLGRSKTGRALRAVRDRDIAASLIGINITRYKLIAFALSSFVVGICGALTAYSSKAFYPASFGLDISIAYLAMIICGGIGSVRGAILGAIFITLLPDGVLYFMNTVVIDMLPSWYNWGYLYSGLHAILYGSTIVLFLILEPEGLNKIWINFRNSITIWPFPYY
ncbi:MAG: branched-chain amino acid ABC transporter permease [Thermodesulfobacteriota bacterium]|nr:branched-chain amino acid ABC transporter permease [Thermodesulfobacteriota bacterium]